MVGYGCREGGVQGDGTAVCPVARLMMTAMMRGQFSSFLGQPCPSSLIPAID